MSNQLRRYRVLVGRHVDGDRTYIAKTKDDVVVTSQDLTRLIKGKFEDLGPVKPQQPEPSEEEVETEATAPEDQAEEEAEEQPPARTKKAKSGGKPKRKAEDWD